MGIQAWHDEPYTPMLLYPRANGRIMRRAIQGPDRTNARYAQWPHFPNAHAPMSLCTLGRMFLMPPSPILYMTLGPHIPYLFLLPHSPISPVLVSIDGPTFLGLNCLFLRCFSYFIGFLLHHLFFKKKFEKIIFRSAMLSALSLYCFNFSPHTGRHPAL